MIKKCPKCRITKNAEEYYKTFVNWKTYLRTYCKMCYNKNTNKINF